MTDREALQQMLDFKLQAAIAAEAGIEYAGRRGDAAAVARHRAELERQLRDCEAIENDIQEAA